MRVQFGKFESEITRGPTCVAHKTKFWTFSHSSTCVYCVVATVFEITWTSTFEITTTIEIATKYWKYKLFLMQLTIPEIIISLVLENSCQNWTPVATIIEITINIDTIIAMVVEDVFKTKSNAACLFSLLKYPLFLIHYFN